MATDLTTYADLKVTLIEGDRDLAAAAEAWNALTRGVPFRRHEWLATWWRHFQRPGDKLFVAVVRDDDGQVVGLAPWYLARDRWMGRVVRFLGTGKACSEYLTLLAAPGAEQLVIRQLADWLKGDARRSWDLLDFDGIDGQDELITGFVQELAETGHQVFRRDRDRTWQLRLTSTWEELIARLPKGRRAKLRAHDRRLQAGEGVHFRTADDAASLKRGLEVFHRLHTARRASLGDSGCLALPEFDRFLAAAAAQFQQLGDLRLQWIEVAGEPAAVELDLLGDDTLYYYQTGMNPELAEISPGWLLQVASIKRAISEGICCFDFLRGDEAYKASWGAEPRQLVQYRIAGRRPWAGLRHQLWVAALMGKNRLLATKEQP